MMRKLDSTVVSVSAAAVLVSSDLTFVFCINVPHYDTLYNDMPRQKYLGLSECNSCVGELYCDIRVVHRFTTL